MECSFRIALWMLFLVGYLQAKSTRMCQGDMGLSLLVDTTDGVVCEDNMTFTSPTNVNGSCITAALNNSIQGLILASRNCTDEYDRIPGTLHALKGCLHPTQPDSTECKWENKESRKNFTSFVNDLISLVEQITNSKGM